MSAIFKNDYLASKQWQKSSVYDFLSSVFRFHVMEYAKYEMHKMILYWAFSYSQFSFIMLFQTYCKL